MLGQVTRSGGTINRYYYLKDHLGDIKMVLNQGGGVDGYNGYYLYESTNRRVVDRLDCRCLEEIWYGTQTEDTNSQAKSRTWRRPWIMEFIPPLAGARGTTIVGEGSG